MRTIEKAACEELGLPEGCQLAAAEKSAFAKLVGQYENLLRYIAENPLEEAVHNINMGKYWHLPEVGSERYRNAVERFSAALMAIVEEK